MTPLLEDIRKKLSKQPGFWFYQIAGFALFILIDSFELIPDFINDQRLLVKYFISFAINFSITLLLRILYRRIYNLRKSIILYVAVSIVVSLFGGFIWIIAAEIITEWLGLADSSNLLNALTNRLPFIYFYRSLIYFTLILFGWSILYFGIKFWMELIAERKRSERIISLAQEAKLQMLRYQVNPHFLFNSLNSIQALMNHNTSLADRMLTQLSDFLRYSLVSDDSLYVPLRKELEIIEKYISIEKIRFGKKLEYRIEVTNESLDKEILCFLLQPLIENCIKHGFKSSPGKLIVMISISTEESWIVIKIKNSGSWKEPENSLGRGIRNVRERLANAYRDKYTFNISKEDRWVNVILKIKLGDEEIQGIYSG